MKIIKFLIFLIYLSSCNKYVGSVDPDYIPTNEVSEIFSNTQTIHNKKKSIWVVYCIQNLLIQI